MCYTVYDKGYKHIFINKGEILMNIDANYKKFVKYLSAYVHRDGIEKLLAWLDKTDVRIAPASTKYHLSCEGGLVKHSLNVFMRLIGLMNAEYPNDCPYSKETIALVALLHDISKVGYYKKYFKNVQNEETGRWEKVMSYATRDEEDRLLYATHEENSVYMLSKFFKLTYDEELAIRYHMGSIGAEDIFAQNRMISAYKRSPLALFLHMADMQAMCIDEVSSEEDDAPDDSTEAKTIQDEDTDTPTEDTDTEESVDEDECDSDTTTTEADNEVPF